MKYIIPTLAIFLLIPTLFLSKNALAGSEQALKIIKELVLPTLFPAGVLSRLLAFSFLSQAASRALSKTLLWRATGLPSKYIPPFLAGIICGFPTGAMLLRDLKGRNKEKALALSSVPSLAFLCRVLGAKKGVCVFSVFVLTLLAVSRFLPTEEEKEEACAFEKMNFPKALQCGIESSVFMSGAILFFLTCLSFVPQKTPQLLKELLFAFCEMGAGAFFSTHPITLALSLSFGGLCILSQISFMSGGVRLRYYLFSRLALFFPTILLVLA